MASRYELWLCDDAGRKVNFLTDLAFFSYARCATGYSTCTVGMAFDEWEKIAPSVYTPDWRIDIWRSPMEGVSMRREKSYLLRKYNVYQRQEDGVRIIELFGRGGTDILRRQYLASFPTVGMSDYLDDIMKYIVTNNILGTATVPSGEFVVDGDASGGPLVTVNFDRRNVLDVLNELQEMSISLNLQSSTNKKVYFDVEEDEGLVTNGFGYRFKTYTDLRGGNRTNGLLFSVENGNIFAPNLYEDHLEAITAFDVFNQDNSAGDASVSNADQYLSRWNYVRDGQSSSDTDPTVNQSTAYAELQKRRYKRVLNVEFLNSPGSADQPRSLYGVDWDLGDLLPVKFAGKTFEVEVKVVYVSVDQNGKETITGRSTIGE